MDRQITKWFIWSIGLNGYNAWLSISVVRVRIPYRPHKHYLNFGMYAGNWFNRPRLERGLCEFESRRPDKL